MNRFLGEKIHIRHLIINFLQIYFHMLMIDGELLAIQFLSRYIFHPHVARMYQSE